MKRFWVALVSIFIFLGGVAFTACGERNLSLDIDKSSISISLDDVNDYEKIVYAKVDGIDKGEVLAKSNDEGVVNASSAYNSSLGQNVITISIPRDENNNWKGKEGSTQIVVTSKDDSSVKKTISVNVFSDIQGMSEKTTGFDKDNDPRFAVRGDSVELNFNDLISISQDTRPECRKDVSWQVAGGTIGARVEAGNKLILDSNFRGEIDPKDNFEYITVVATSVYNPSISTNVKLRVLNKIDINSVSITYSQTSSGFNPLPDEAIQIVPNVSNDESDGYLRLTFKGSNLLDVNPIIDGDTIQGVDENGRITYYQILKAERNGFPEYDAINEEYVYTYRIFALDQYLDDVNGNIEQVSDPVINGDSKIAFNIKYSGYGYGVNSQIVNVGVYEKINKLVVNRGGNDATSGNGHTIYTSYSNRYGEPFVVSLLPTTVVNKTGRFTIKVSYDINDAGFGAPNLINENTLFVYYRTRQGYSEALALRETGDNQTYELVNPIPAGVSEVFFVANDANVKNPIRNVEVTFTALDNPDFPDASKTIKLNLYQSASSLTFANESELQVTAPTAEDSPKEILKELILSGQTTLQGLTAQSVGEGFSVEILKDAGTFRVGDDNNSIIFTVKLTISGVGYTTVGESYYFIKHENGRESNHFSVSLFLPLTDARIQYFADTAFEGTDYEEIIDERDYVNSYSYNNQIFVLKDNILIPQTQNLSSSLSELLVRTSSTIKFNVSTNPAGGRFAKATAQFRFFDRTEKNKDLFDNLSLDNPTSLARLLNDALRTSVYLSFSANGTLNTTELAGSTYMLAMFSGLDENANPITLVRIIKIQTNVVMGVMTTSSRMVTVYANDSVNDDASSTQKLSVKHVSISLGERLVEPVTFADFANFKFTSSGMKEPKINTANIISWENGLYNITNVHIDGKILSFDLTGLTTNGNPILTDDLIITYSHERVYRTIVLNVEILNADRIESVEWRNSDENGLYFEKNLSNQSALLVFSTSPTNAKDKSLKFFVTTKNGTPANFVSVKDIDGRGQVYVDPSQGASGYIYVLPNDSFNSNYIKYYYKGLDGKELSNSLLVSKIGEPKDENGSWFDYLAQNAYFKTNNKDEKGNPITVGFDKIMVRIPVTIADGEGWDTAYRLIHAQDFTKIQNRPTSYFTVMNSVTLSNWTGADFFGGIQGLTGNETITLDGNSTSFVNTLNKPSKIDENNKGGIRNIKFAGQVYGNGFVANQNDNIIDNVTVDVYIKGNNVSSSIVNYTGEFAGGLVGINNGEILNSGALGVSIVKAASNAQENTYVGGLAGQLNASGKIENTRFEIYTFKNLEEKIYYNTLNGTYVGGLLGFANGGSVSLSYAYDYSMIENEDKTNCNLIGANKGGFIGYLNASTSFDQVFSVVNHNKAFGSANAEKTAEDKFVAQLALSDAYLSYYKENVYTSLFTSDGGFEEKYNNQINASVNSENWLYSGSENYLSYVNGDGDQQHQHLKNIYQERPLSQEEVLDSKINKSVKDNRYYQSINVDKDNAVLFFYDTMAEQESLYSQEREALASYNRISLENLFGENAENLILTSSDLNTVETTNGVLTIKRTGDVILTVSSRQNYAIVHKINVSVVYALSNIKARVVTNSLTQSLENGGTQNLQKEQNLFVQYNLQNQEMYLGVTSLVPFTMKSNNSPSTEKFGNVITLKTGENNLPVSNLAGNGLTLQTNKNTAVESMISTFVTLDVFNGKAAYQNAIRENFQHNFTLSLFEGAITLSLSEKVLPITPNQTGVLDVALTTNNIDDYIGVEISYDGKTLTSSGSEKGRIEFSYAGEVRLIATIADLTDKPIEPSDSGRYILNFRINFAVADSYKLKVSDTQDYQVNVYSFSKVKSQEFTLQVDKQDFTNLDMRVYSTQGVYVGGGVTTYSLGEAVTVLKPGDSALVSVNVNPAYAYFDYFTMTVDGGATVNAVSLGYMTNYRDFQDKFIDGSYATITGGVIVDQRPDLSEENPRVVFRLWINPNVNYDATLKLTISFFKNGQEKPLDYANRYISISYLQEPKLYVDGQENNVLLARGTTVPVVVEVDQDQTIDISSASISNVEDGVQLSRNWVEESKNGRKTYTSSLTANLTSSLKEGASEFYLTVRVSRVINGVTEWKSAEANIKLVNFTIDPENLILPDEVDNNFVTYIGIPKVLSFNYSFNPESYTYDKNNIEAVNKAEELRVLRNEFNRTNFYNAEESINYSINYKYKLNEQGKPVYDNGRKVLEQIPVWERLSYWSNTQNSWVSIYNTQTKTFNQVAGYFDFVIENPVKDENGRVIDGNLTVAGVGLTNSSMRFKLQTLIQNGSEANSIAVKDYIFTMEVKPHSSEDLPLIIRNETDFLALDPANAGEAMSNAEPQDYILTNDIVLSEYTPFSTNLIRSLDGNGYTIYINSFDLDADPIGGMLSLALFNQVKAGTTLKNIRVNIYNGGQIDVNVSKYTNGAQIAGFAIENENGGIITNCEVVAYFLEKKTLSKVSNPGINVRFVKALGDETELEMKEGVSWAGSRVAGFVLDNRGNITNSRVGGRQITRITERVANLASSVVQELPEFNISAQGNMAGFVLNNTKAISSCYVQNLGMTNNSQHRDKYLAGFVGQNSGKILSSYVEGVKEENQTDSFCNQGSTISSSIGVIAGFVYENSNEINNSYSNILLSNNRADNYISLAAGFIYHNQIGGNVENCYSASQITALKYSQMNFSGVSYEGKPLNEGNAFVNCYYYSSSYYGSNSATEEAYETGVTKLTDVTNQNYFYGFAFAENALSRDGVWYIDPNGGVKLVEPNIIAISHRYEVAIDKVNEHGKTYELPYARVETADEDQPINTAYGSKDNPIIIRTAQEFNSVMGGSTYPDIEANFRNGDITGTYRLVDDINLGSLPVDESGAVNLSSISRSFTGKFYGNGFSINNISINTKDKRFTFGMFGSIENATMFNFNLSINQVVNNQAAVVGSLAGIANNAKLVNINITNNEGARIEGSNFVGGMLGMAFGNTSIKNVTIADANVLAKRYEEDSNYQVNENDSAIFTHDKMVEWRDEFYASTTKVKLTTTKLSQDKLNSLYNYIDSRSYSYAGGLVGYADVFGVGENPVYQYAKKTILKDYSISTLRASGVINVKAQVAGGLFGFQGVNSKIMDAGVTFAGNQTSNNSHIVATKFYAGGVVGQANSALSQVFAKYDATTQLAIEDSINAYYTNGSGELGALDIFATGKENETYKNLAVGGLVGLVNGGSMTISYSKINAISNSSNFAGGVIGQIDTAGRTTYRPDDGNKEFETNYLMNEVYSTGDVRAKFDTDMAKSGRAGGIVGRIKENSHVSLMAVNAINKFTVKNYATGEDFTSGDFINNGQTSFAGIGVYAIAGKIEGVYDKGANGELILNQNKLKNTLSFIDIAQTQGEGDDVKVNHFPSVGFVANYEITPVSNLVNVKLSAYEDYSFENKTQNDFYVENYTGFTSASFGYQTTFGVFIGGNGLWSTENWEQTDNKLFPEIRYTIAKESFVWLDAYDASIRNAIREMTASSNVEVRVRGYESQGSNKVIDIDLRTIIDSITGLSDGSVTAYAGRILTNKEEWGAKENGEAPRLLLSKPLFSSVGGINAKNLIIEYSKENYNPTGNTLFDDPFNSPGRSDYAGAFIKDTISNASFSNIEIYVKDTIYLRGSNKGNYGLLAASMENCNIQGVKIFNQSSGNPLIDIFGASGVVNVGLIAGEYSQSTLSTSDLTISGLELTTQGLEAGNTRKNNIISFSSGKATSANIGAFFGHVAKEATCQQNLNFRLGNIQNDGNFDNFSVLNVQDLNAGSVNIGGQVGLIENVAGELGSFSKNQIAIELREDLSKCNAGLVFGQTVGTYHIGAQGEIKKIEGSIKTFDKSAIGNANLGGLVGEANDTLTLTNISADVQISGDGNNNWGNETSIERFIDNLPYSNDANTMPSMIESINVSKSANIGGLVGQAQYLIYNGSENQANIINENRLPLAVTLMGEPSLLTTNNGRVNMGGIVGQAIQANISNKVISNATMYYNFESTQTTRASKITAPYANLGGFVGSISGSETKENLSDQSSTISGSKDTGGNATLTQLVRTHFFTFGNAVVGGIVGDSQVKADLTIQGTSFGGAHKVLGGNTAIFGGTIGNQKEGNLILKNNVNYGDFFNFGNTKISTFIFGGLIGSGKTDTEAENNYSLVTNHNTLVAKDWADNSVGALFGQGVGGIEKESVSADDSLKNNFFNHALSMATDKFGSDMGYATAYTDADSQFRGYGANKVVAKNEDQKTNANILKAIENGFSAGGINTEEFVVSSIQGFKDLIKDTDTVEGTKFNPIIISKEENVENQIDYTRQKDEQYLSTNGIKYYALGGDLRLELTDNTENKINHSLFKQTHESGDNTKAADSTRELNNIALIGDSWTIDYLSKVDFNHKEETLPTLINTISNYGFVSGLNIVSNVESETVTTATVKTKTQNNQKGEVTTFGEYYYGGLVNQMTNGKIYSVGISGAMSIGGSEYITIGGLVGHMSGGHIDESNSAVNVIYRAKGKDDAKTTVISGLAGYIDGNVWVKNSYTSGSMFTYTSADLYALANNSSNTLTLSSVYTIARMEITDVTTIDVKGERQIVNSTSVASKYYYSKAASEVEESLFENKKNSINESLLTDTTTPYDWQADYSYNYHYPIRKNIYTHATSYYVQADKLEDNQERGIERWVYERVATNALDVLGKKTSDEKSYYYGIPNAEVLENLKDVGDNSSEYLTLGTPKLVLLNNLDMDKAYDKWTSISISKIGFVFDGNNKAIKNLKCALFDTIGESVVKSNVDGVGFPVIVISEEKNINVKTTTIRNFRIVDMLQKDEGSSTGIAALAITVNRAKIYNVSTQGEINGIKGNYNLGENFPAHCGGIAAFANCSEFKGCSNLVSIISYTTNEEQNDEYKYNDKTAIGGIVGIATNTTLDYCNNAGVINVLCGRYVGGLVGQLTSNAYGKKVDIFGAEYYGLVPTGGIDHSYNAGGIAVAYNNTDFANNAYIGGLAGESAVKICNSYNTGLIKFGTKSYGKNKNTGEDNKYASYIGGIVGRIPAVSNDVYLQNCLNEASVEGRSNSSWKFSDDKLRLKLVQGTSHIYVSGIGYTDELRDSYRYNFDDYNFKKDLARQHKKNNSPDVEHIFKTVSVSKEAEIIINGNGYAGGEAIAWFNKSGAEYIANGSEIGLGFVQNTEYFRWAYGGWLYSNFLERYWKGYGSPTKEPFGTSSGDLKGSSVELYEHRNEGKQDSYGEDGSLNSSGNKIEVLSYDNYGFPKAIRIPYTIYQSFSCYGWFSNSKSNGVNTAYKSSSIGYFYYSPDYYVGLKTWKQRNDFSVGNEENNIQGNLRANYKPTKEDDTNYSWSKLKEEITSFDSGSADEKYTQMYINGENYYVTLGDAEEIYGILKNDVADYTATYTVDEGLGDGQLPALGSADKYQIVIKSKNNSEVPENLLTKVTSYDYNEDTKEITLGLKIETSEKDVDWSDFDISIEANYTETKDVDLSGLNIEYNKDSGEVTINLDDEQIEQNQDILDSTGVYKVKDNTGKIYYLNFNGASLIYTKDLSYNGTTVNTESLTPAYFKNKFLSFEKTTTIKHEIEYTNLKDFDKDNSYVDHKVTLPSDRIVTVTQSHETINFSEENNISVSNGSYQEVYEYNEISGNIKFNSSIPYEEPETTDPEVPVDPEAPVTIQRYLKNGSTTIATLTYTLETNEDDTKLYNLTDVEINRASFTEYVDGKEMIVSLTKQADNSINYSISNDEHATVSDSNTTAVENIISNLTVSEEDVTKSYTFNSTQKLYGYKDIKFTYSLPTDVARAGVVNGNRLLAKYDGVWSLGDGVNEETIDGYKFIVSQEGNNLIFTRLHDGVITTTDIENLLAGLKESLNKISIVKQITNQTSWTITSTLDASKNMDEVSILDGNVKYSYVENYSYDNLDSGLNVDTTTDKGTGIKAESSLSGNVVSTTITATPNTLGENDGFTVLQGSYTYGTKTANLTQKVGNFSNLQVTAQACENEWLNFELKSGDEILKTGEGENASLNYSVNKPLQEFEISAKIIRKFIELSAQKDSENQSFNYSFNMPVTSKGENGLNYNFVYSYDSAPRIYGFGNVLKNEDEIYFSYDIDSEGNISWLNNVGDEILYYNSSEKAYYKHFKSEVKDLSDYAIAEDETFAGETYWQTPIYYKKLIINGKEYQNAVNLINRNNTLDLPSTFKFYYNNNGVKTEIGHVDLENYKGVKEELNITSLLVSSKGESDAETAPMELLPTEGNYEHTATMYYADADAKTNNKPFAAKVKTTFTSGDGEKSSSYQYFVFDYYEFYKFDQEIEVIEGEDETQEIITDINIKLTEEELTGGLIFDSFFNEYNVADLLKEVPVSLKISGMTESRTENEVKYKLFIDDDNTITSDMLKTSGKYRKDWITTETISTKNFEGSLNVRDKNVEIVFDVPVNVKDLNVETTHGRVDFSDYVNDDEAWELKDNTLTFSYKPSSIENNFNINVKKAFAASFNGKFNAEDTQTAEDLKGIILAKNLYLQEAQNITSFGVELIGYDYMISYYNDQETSVPLFGTITSPFIKDTNFVGQVNGNGYNGSEYPNSGIMIYQNRAVLVNKVEKNATLNAINVYGSFRNVKFDSKGAAGVVGRNDGLLQSLNSFVSINSLNNNYTYEEYKAKIAGISYVNNGNFKNVAFRGIMTAGDGKEGQDGMRGLNGLERISAKDNTFANGEHNSFVNIDFDVEHMKATSDSTVYFNSITINAYGENGEKGKAGGAGGNAYIYYIDRGEGETAEGTGVDIVNNDGIARSGNGGSAGAGGPGGRGADWYELLRVAPGEKQTALNKANSLKSFLENNVRELNQEGGEGDYWAGRTNYWMARNHKLYYLGNYLISSFYQKLNDRGQQIAWFYDGNPLVSNATEVGLKSIRFMPTIEGKDYYGIDGGAESKLYIANNGGNGAVAGTAGSAGELYCYGSTKIEEDENALDQSDLKNFSNCKQGESISATGGDGGRGGAGGNYALLDNSVYNGRPTMWAEGFVSIRSGYDGISSAEYNELNSDGQKEANENTSSSNMAMVGDDWQDIRYFTDPSNPKCEELTEGVFAKRTRS